MARGTKNRPGTPKEKQEPTVEQAAAVMVLTAEEPEAEVEIPIEEEMPAESKLTVTQRCQEAKETSCSCRCRGKYHGKEHPAGWKDEVGCEPLSKEERKIAKKEALKQWRRAHPERVAAYMKGWFATSDAPTAQASRTVRARQEAKALAKGVTETENNA